MKNSCMDFYTILDQTHKSFLELMNHELETIEANDLTPIQGFIILNIGDSNVSLSDLVLKRGYSGSNASYNIKKMVTGGYLKQIPAPHDKRSFLLTLTEKGKVIFDKLKSSMDVHAQRFEHIIKDRINYRRATRFLKEVDNYWRNSLNEW